MLLHGTLKSVALWQYFFTKSQIIYKKPKYYFGNYLQKAQIQFWQLLTKAQYYLGNYLQSSILFWQLLTKTQYYLGNYFQKPNIILASFIKKPKTIGQTIILHKPKYYLAKELYYAQSRKLFFGKNIFWLWEIEKIASQKERFLECFLGHLSFWVSGVELPLIFL